MLKTFVLTFSFLFLAFQSLDCSILKNAKFTYKRGKNIVQVHFEGNNHTELHNNGKHFIKSTIEWISDCRYNLTVTETNLPDFPFKMGTKLQVTVTKVKGDNVYYKCLVNKRNWEGKLSKVKE